MNTHGSMDVLEGKHIILYSIILYVLQTEYCIIICHKFCNGIQIAVEGGVNTHEYVSVRVSGISIQHVQVK